MKKSSDARCLEDYMSLRYKIELIPDEVKGGYVAQHPELPGCLTYAVDIPTALAMLEDAKKEWLTAALEGGYPIPMPRTVTPSKVKVTFRVDKGLKEQVECILTNLGLDMSTAINIFLRKVVAERGIPFQISIN